MNIRINFSFDQTQGFWPVRGILERMAEEVNATQGAAYAFFSISLVVAEILNNSIQHRMTFKISGQIRVRQLSCQNCVEIKLIDTGCVYHPPKTPFGTDPLNPSESGYGWMILFLLCTRIQHRHINGRIFHDSACPSTRLERKSHAYDIAAPN